MNEITNRFLELFYKLSQIPRESGKEKRFADFLDEFAKENNLECYRDKNNNVLIFHAVFTYLTSAQVFCPDLLSPD